MKFIELSVIIILIHSSDDDSPLAGLKLMYYCSELIHKIV